jgi:hypothetical protein
MAELCAMFHEALKQQGFDDDAALHLTGIWLDNTYLMMSEQARTRE